MRKLAILAALLISCIGLQAQEQEYYIYLFHSGQVTYTTNVNEINNLQFQGTSPTNLLINGNGGTNSIPLTSFDSITFMLQYPPQPGDAVVITYNGNAVTIDNPYANEGVEVSHNGADVIINSMKSSVSYCIYYRHRRSRWYPAPVP